MPTITSPVETYIDGTIIRDWQYKDAASSPNYIPLDEAYMDGIIVYRRELVLTLPEYVTPINLSDYIANNNPDNYKVIRIVNNYTQPTIYTGQLGYPSDPLLVTLENNGDILGFSSGDTALVVQAPIKLINNGYIKGAGGVGGTGQASNGVSRQVGAWEHRSAYDDGGPYVEGQMSPLANSTQNGPYYNRFWKTAGGVNSGAWALRDGTNQHYFDTNSASNWGDYQDVYRHSGVTLRHNTGTGLLVVVEETEGYTAGAGGLGGAGQSFSNPVAEAGHASTSGTHYGPTSGFNPSTGYNLAPLTQPSTSNGGNGGDFGSNGASVTGGGAGGSAGNAITGYANLTTGSNTGNTIGAVV